VRAEKLRLIIDELLKKDDSCQVQQIRTHTGYSWTIDFRVALKQHIEVEKLGDGLTTVLIAPRIPCLNNFETRRLDDNYRITNESDLDLLQGKYKLDYADAWKEEEETWKLHTLIPHHRKYLESKYSREQVFYLNLYHRLMTLKELNYGKMNDNIRDTLDHSIIDVQNIIEFMLLIVAESDDKGEWGGQWSVSQNHDQAQYYYVPEADDLTFKTKIDIATEWLKKDLTFFIPPTLFLPIFSILTRYQMENSMQSIYRSWSGCCASESKTNNWIYVKSKISAREWADSKALSHLLPSHQHIGDALSNASWLNYYHKRTHTSLLHILFRNAECVGCQIPAGRIEWFNSAEDNDTLKNLLESMRRHPRCISLLCNRTSKTHTRAQFKWLFALQCAAMDSSEKKTNLRMNMLAHLIFYNDVNYWGGNGEEDLSLLVHMSKSLYMNSFIEQYKFIYKKVYMRDVLLEPDTQKEWLIPLNVVSMKPQPVERQKKIMDEESLKSFKIYGLCLHHVEDQIYNYKIE
jgi:hypothetical protein